MTRRRPDKTRPGVQYLRYREPQANGRGDLLSPRAEAKRALEAEFLRRHGHTPTPKQSKRFLGILRAEAKQAQLSRTGVLGTGGEAA